ncbi:MAG TPA: S8 family serine peptidase [Pilimelia sp.]|nr:S8 family serine peptidase [Pilimelia sp.]
MRTLSYRTLAALCAAALAAAAPAPSAAAPGRLAPATAPVLHAGDPHAVPGSFIVALKSDAAGRRTAAAALAGRYRAAVTATYTGGLTGFAARMPLAAARQVAADPAVAYVEQDRWVRAAGLQRATAWGLDRVDQRRLPLSRTYRYPSGRTAVTAYVLDTGVRVTHSELRGRARYGYDFVSRRTAAADCQGHGTHVAGTIGGTRYGVAKSVRLVAVRVLNCAGWGRYSDIVAGVNWVTAHARRPAVANLSLGGGASRALDDAVRRSIARGVTYVVAAGNEGRNACAYSPARVPEAVTVGATDARDIRAGFSNYGSCLDIWAPGVSVLSAYKSGDTALAKGSGTSMAAPHVAGAVALLLARWPTMRPAQVAAALATRSTKGRVSRAGTSTPNRLLFVS